jgi:hypothetical protein
MKTHTPGPWKVFADTITTANDSIKIAEVPTNNEAKKEWQANANLIAAAPELLEALEMLLRITYKTSKTPEVKAAIEAIKKATGEQTNSETNREWANRISKQAIHEDSIPVSVEVPNNFKTPDEISKLKQDWLKDPCWDIYSTQGFERFRDELKEFQNTWEQKWKVNERIRLEEKANSMHCSIPMVRELERLNAVIQQQQQTIDRIMQMELKA